MNIEIRRRLRERQPGQRIESALEQLLENDAVLLDIDVNERTIMYRLAMYVQQQFPDKHVDCEYNRDDVEPKRIQHLGLYPDAEDTEMKTAFPDLIIHERGTATNYLVCEAKKSSNHANRDSDYAKLRGYKANLGFEHALFIEFETEQGAGIKDVEWVDGV